MMISPLRDLAHRLRKTAQAHFAYSQVAELMNVVDGYINAMARIEEINHDLAGRDCPEQEGSAGAHPPGWEEQHGG
jgi:hypothetical protein